MAKSIRLVMGLDLGDRVTHVSVLDRATGEVVSESKVATRERELVELFERTGRCRVVMETGTHSPWISRLASRAGHEVLVAHARALRAIWDSPKKHDRGDAGMLARLGTTPHLLHVVAHRGEGAQRELALLRLRESQVDARTKLINAARGGVKSLGERLAPCSSESFHRSAAKTATPATRELLAPQMAAIEALSASIRRCDKEIDALCARRPETARMRQVDGVGPVTALAFALVIDDPRRFARSRDVGAYVGVVPRLDQSGTIDRQLGITKCGDRMLRRLLVQCAHRILGPHGKDCDLRRWGLALGERGGGNAKKRAVVAVARKLAVLLHALWVRPRAYEPLRGSSAA